MSTTARHVGGLNLSAVAGATVAQARSQAALYPRRAAAVIVVLALALGLGGGYVFSDSPVLVVCALLLPLVFLAAVQHVQLGLYLTIMIITVIPFGVAPMPIAGVEFSFVELALGVTAALWLLRSLLAPEGRIRVTPVGLLVGMFVGVTAVAFANGTAYGFSVADLRLYLKGAVGTLAFFNVVNSFGEASDGRNLVLVLAAGGVIAAVVGIYVFFLPYGQALTFLNNLGPLGYPTGPDLLRYHVESERLRAVGTSIDPNALGALLMVSAIVTLGQVLAPRPLAHRGWFVAALPFLVAGLLLTLSRSSWVGAAVGFTLLFLVRFRWVWPLAAVGILGAVAVFVLGLDVYLTQIPVVGRYVGHLLTGLRAQDQATLMRLGEYKDAFILISRYPWLGVGYTAAPSVDLYIGVSSLFLLLAENAGLLGLGTYLLAVGVAVVNAARTALPHRDEPLAWLTLGCVAAVAGALASGIFDHPFINPRFVHLVALFWTVIGAVVWSTERLRSKTRDAEEGG